MNEKNLFYFFCSRSLYNYDVITWRKDIIDSLLPFKFFFFRGKISIADHNPADDIYYLPDDWDIAFGCVLFLLS